MEFRNREHAAELLIPLLRKYIGGDGVVFAIPRGGVPIGRILADHLHWPLKPLLIKKIGHPTNTEYAIGAVSLDQVLLDDLVEPVSNLYLENEVYRLRRMLQDCANLYGQESVQLDLLGKTVIIVDDGIATGRTLLAGVLYLRKYNPTKIIVAVPVAAREAAVRIQKEVDEFICLHTPEQFVGVGEFYSYFPQVNDEQVITLLHV